MNRALLGLALATTVACSSEVSRLAVVHVDAGPRDAAVGDGGSGLPDGSLALPSCIDRARWIYVVDFERHLLRFEPTTLTFFDVSGGPLGCTATATPFSMAVDHDAVAWILYSNGRIYRASTVDGACVDSGFVPNQHNVPIFGMGFSAVDTLAPDETLYVAGSDGTKTVFGSIAQTSLVLTPAGVVVGSPELTGNALAELWGFFPDVTAPRIARLQTTDGSELVAYDLTTLGPDHLGTGDPKSWAFAFWGGDYYVFHHTMTEASTSVYRFDPGTVGVAPTFVRVLADTGRDIVGAGVSTCVPYVIE